VKGCTIVTRGDVGLASRAGDARIAQGGVAWSRRVAYHNRARLRYGGLQGDAMWRRRVTLQRAEGLRSMGLQGEAVEGRRATWGGRAGGGKDVKKSETRMLRRERQGGQEGILWATT